MPASSEPCCSSSAASCAAAAPASRFADAAFAFAFCSSCRERERCRLQGTDHSTIGSGTNPLSADEFKEREPALHEAARREKQEKDNRYSNSTDSSSCLHHRTWVFGGRYIASTVSIRMTA